VYARFDARYRTTTSPATSSFDAAAMVIEGVVALVEASAGSPPAASKLPATLQAAVIRHSFNTRSCLSRPAIPADRHSGQCRE
jgi:hypothetical protein